MLAFRETGLGAAAGRRCAAASRRLHLVVLDTSLSMSYGDRWQRAVAEANGIVDGMQGGDRAQIIATGPGVQVLTADQRPITTS